MPGVGACRRHGRLVCDVPHGASSNPREKSAPGLFGIYVTRICSQAVTTVLTQSGRVQVSVELVAGRAFGPGPLQLLRVSETAKEKMNDQVANTLLTPFLFPLTIVASTRDTFAI